MSRALREGWKAEFISRTQAGLGNAAGAFASYDELPSVVVVKSSQAIFSAMLTVDPVSGFHNKNVMRGLV